MKQYSNEIRLISKEKLETTQDIKAYIIQTEKDITDAKNIRQKYRNKLRNCTDENLINEYKSKRDDFTTILNNHMKNLKIANQIIEDIPEIKEVINIEKQAMKEEREIKKNKNKDREGR